MPLPLFRGKYSTAALLSGVCAAMPPAPVRCATSCSQRVTRFSPSAEESAPRGSRFCTSIATGLPATRILTNRTSGSAQSVVAMDKHTMYSSWMPICSAAEDRLTVQTCPAVVMALPCASDTLP